VTTFPKPATTPAPAASAGATAPASSVAVTAEDLSRAQVSDILRRYYADLNSGDFDAPRYFTSSIERYITMEGTTPAKINHYIHRIFPTQYKQHHFEMEPDSLEPGDAPGEFVYVEQSKYFQVAKKRTREQRVRVRVRLASDGKLGFFRQFEVLKH
jgi:hypothetical protein